MADKPSASAAAAATSTLKAQIIPPRKRGRPKTKVEDTAPKLKLLDKLKAAAKNKAASKPAIYASTTKGGVKLLYEGHLFKFSFRKAEYSVFQCCFREHGEECKVRVVCDQKNVFPFDGEHVHFMQASDKSVTSSQFMPGDGIVETKTAPNVEIVIRNTKADLEPDDDGELFELHEIEESDALDSPAGIETLFAEAKADEETEKSTEEAVDPNDFREKIKRRLQKALQNKKK